MSASDMQKEWEIRKRELETNPLFKNFKEGFWQSPNKTKTMKVCASYEAVQINIHEPGQNWSTSINPIVWDMLFSEWTYLGPDKSSAW